MMTRFLFLPLIPILLISGCLSADTDDDATYYYFCKLERSSDLKDSFKDEYVFHLKSSKDDTAEDSAEITKSKRWNLSTLTLHKSGILNLDIKENHKGSWHTLNKTIQLEGISNTNPVKVEEVYVLTVDKTPITFSLQCE